MPKYQKGYIFNGSTFVVNKEDVHNATDNMFVEATALLPDGWISVKDGLPEAREDVIVVAFWHEAYQAFIGWYSPSSGIWRVNVGTGDRDALRVTHWMPIPPPPKEVDHG